MKPVGVPTLLSHQRLSGATADLRRSAEAARIEVVTGRIADLPKALGRAVGEAHLLRKAVDDIAQQREAMARAAFRGTIAQNMLADISSGAAALNADIAAALGRNDEKTIAAASVAANDALHAAVSRLNTRLEGRAIFAGDDADGAALAGADLLLADVAALYAGAATPAQLEADLDFYFNDPAGGFQTTIYQGGAGEMSSLEIAPGETVNPTARADEQGIKDILRGLATIAVAGAGAPSPDRNTALTNAGAKLLVGADGVVAIRTRVGVEEQRIAAVGARLDAEEPAMNEAYNAMTARDPFDAASRLQAFEAQIDASYVLTSRLSRLTLANYL